MNTNTTISDYPPYEDGYRLDHCVHREFELNGHTFHGEFHDDELLELHVTKPDGDGRDQTVHRYDNVSGPSVKYDYRKPDGNRYNPTLVREYEITVPALRGRIIKLSLCEDKVLHLYLCTEDRNGNENFIGGTFSPDFNLDEMMKN